MAGVYNVVDDGRKGNIVAAIGRVKNGLLILRYAQDDKKGLRMTGGSVAL